VQEDKVMSLDKKRWMIQDVGLDTVTVIFQELAPCHTVHTWYSDLVCRQFESSSAYSELQAIQYAFLVGPILSFYLTVYNVLV